MMKTSRLQNQVFKYFYFFLINNKTGKVIENSTSGGKHKQENEVCEL